MSHILVPISDTAATSDHQLWFLLPGETICRDFQIFVDIDHDLRIVNDLERSNDDDEYKKKSEIPTQAPNPSPKARSNSPPKYS